jgi:hypothetical protein
MMLTIDPNIIRKIFKHVQLNEQKHIALVCTGFYNILKPYFPLDETAGKSVDRLVWQKKSLSIEKLYSNFVSMGIGDGYDALMKMIPKLFYYGSSGYPKNIPYHFHPINRMCYAYEKEKKMYQLAMYRSVQVPSTKLDPRCYLSAVSLDFIEIFKRFCVKRNIDVYICDDPILRDIHPSQIKKIIGWHPDMCYDAIPCCCHKIKVECMDGNEYTTPVAQGADLIVALYQLCNRPKIPDHFDYMFQNDELLGRINNAKKELINVKI